MEVTLQAEVRTGTGKGVARRLRVSGRVPAVLYGLGAQSVSVAVDRRALAQALHTEAGRNVLIDLMVDGESHLTLAREIQRDVVRGDLIHVDFLKIARDVAIQVDVPIHVTGQSPGVKEGGVIEHHLWNVRVECLPGKVPERLDADVSRLAIGDALRVGDLVPPEGITILTSLDETVLSVVVPQILKVEEEVPAPVEGEEAAPVAEGEAPPEGAAPEEKGEES